MPTTDIHAIVLTGGERFLPRARTLRPWRARPRLRWQPGRNSVAGNACGQIRKPLIAAVNGFALGGGAELVWVCDLVVAGESARFGQAEIALGIMPGGGGTQRLPRAIGKARAMEMVLLGEPISAWDALEAGLVNRVVPDELTLTAALRLAQRVAAKSLDAAIAAKSAVLASFDLPMEEGLDLERDALQRPVRHRGCERGNVRLSGKAQTGFGSEQLVTSFASPCATKPKTASPHLPSTDPMRATPSIRSWPNRCWRH